MTHLGVIRDERTSYHGRRPCRRVQKRDLLRIFLLNLRYPFVHFRLELVMLQDFKTNEMEDRNME